MVLIYPNFSSSFVDRASPSPMRPPWKWSKWCLSGTIQQTDRRRPSNAMGGRAGRASSGKDGQHDCCQRRRPRQRTDPEDGRASISNRSRISWRAGSASIPNVLRMIMSSDPDSRSVAPIGGSEPRVRSYKHQPTIPIIRGRKARSQRPAIASGNVLILIDRWLEGRASTADKRSSPILTVGQASRADRRWPNHSHRHDSQSGKRRDRRGGNVGVNAGGDLDGRIPQCACLLELFTRRHGAGTLIKAGLTIRLLHGRREALWRKTKSLPAISPPRKNKRVFGQAKARATRGSGNFVFGI